MRRSCITAASPKCGFPALGAARGAGEGLVRPALPLVTGEGAAPLRRMSTQSCRGVSAAWASRCRGTTSSLSWMPTLRRSVERRSLATEPAGASGSADASSTKPSQQEKKDQKKEKEDQRKENEQKREQEDEEDQDRKQWDKERDTKGGYKQEVNTFQKVLAVLIPVAAVGIGVKTLLDLRGQGMEDDTLQVDMNAVMSHVFQTTVYNVLDSKKLISMLGDPLLVEPTKAKFSFTKDFAWICYPLYGPHGHVCTVTVDVLRIDPTKETVKLKKPHMWYVAQIEVDIGNGKKVLIGTKMEGVKQPFNVIQLFGKIWADMKKQEEEYLRQQAAAARP